MSDFIRFREVSFFRNNNPILNNLSFSIGKGESLVILGRNGAGKTTLINLLFGYLWPTSGSITVLGEEYGSTPLKPIQNKIGILQSAHQEHLLQKSLTAEEVIITGIHGTLGLYNDITEEQIRIAKEKLNSLGIAKKADQKYTTLSSGEKTKVLLLRSIGLGKEILILDEPAAALDLTARYELNQSISKIKEDHPHLTRILITHRLDEIPTDFDQVMLIKNGTIIKKGEKKDTLTKEYLSDLYDLNLNVQVKDGQYNATFG
ncbi:ABC transporter ATP-binding protein [Leptospira idonii]|uniref:ATP-binding cassette domain-containing protein n=1 Tax=Leptospira idonii TaxID=1193500 RepID=A0A4R9M120_9LEPT|nr:ATP-binding cassette domain-containing protein [Leptospira idonii]TGN19377.1 ATP-binding cassette domain-containing protein [Leptospira idonii]